MKAQALVQGFSNPSVFDPDRFSPERKEDIKYQKNFLTFGHGPHYCVGKDYAVNQIICYLANLSTRSASVSACTLHHQPDLLTWHVHSRYLWCMSLLSCV